jgi:hypothetical protein
LLNDRNWCLHHRRLPFFDNTTVAQLHHSLTILNIVLALKQIMKAVKIKWKGANKMKRITTLTFAMLFALSFGTAYAKDNLTKSADISGEISNGVTLFVTGPAILDVGPVGLLEERSEMGSAAGGMESKEYYESASDLGPGNGITAFVMGPALYDVGPVGLLESRVEGSAAGGRDETESIAEFHNGITSFIEGPAIFDAGPVGDQHAVGTNW